MRLIRRIIDHLADHFFRFVFRLIWDLVKFVFIGPIAPILLGRDLWKAWYPRGISPNPQAARPPEPSPPNTKILK
jgi:hypothetical protein